jgi:hypothetical protein
MGRTTQERPLVIRPLKGTPKEVGNVQVARADEAHFRDLTARLPDVDRRFIAEGMRIVPKRDTYHTGALMHARRLAAADAELASSLDIPVVIFDDEDHSLTAGSSNETSRLYVDIYSKHVAEAHVPLKGLLHGYVRTDPPALNLVPSSGSSAEDLAYFDAPEYVISSLYPENVDELATHPLSRMPGAIIIGRPAVEAFFAAKLQGEDHAVTATVVESLTQYGFDYQTPTN